MKIKYFKNQEEIGDTYMQGEDDMNLIHINQKDFFCFANDEGGPRYGWYSNMNMTQNEYEELRNLALEQDRKKGISLLRKIHDKKSNKKKESPLFYGEIPNYKETTKRQLLERFNDSKPILE